MKVKLLVVTLSAVFAAGCAQLQQPPATAPAAAAQPAAAEAAMVRYKHVVDYAYVRPHAALPRKAEDGALLVDSRPARLRYDIGHIQGSINIPDTQFDKLTHLLPQDKNREIIFYCQGPKCDLSAKSALKAEKLGYKNLKVYEGGVPDWEAKGEISSVSTAFVLRALEEKAPIVFIDSRPARPFNQGTIPGAINISDTNFDKETGKLPKDKATELVFFCGGLMCDLSEKSAKKAKALGYTKVRKYTLGYPAYKAAVDAKPAAAAAAPAAAPAAAAPAPAAAGAVLAPGKEKGSVTAASFERVLKESPASIMVVDVRDAKDVATGTFPGAVNIPVGEIEKRIGELPKNKPVVFTCATGARSGEAFDMVKLIDDKLPVHFLDAEVSFSGGKYTIKGR